ncbi:hypothetical protein JTE90_029074 [Oedothorax gibbosus]|uniref:Uncharacterized protein n=1 Tax=Oedothorax gibbosus TaxID=931172 RepID=A0AAV6UVK8_9ARAC|nr:hypothetical protein JTE90_029074 [Oedothorax gibbosus]
MDNVKETDNDGYHFNTKTKDSGEATRNVDAAYNFEDRYTVKAEEIVGIPDIVEVELCTVKAKEKIGATEDFIFEAKDKKIQIEQKVQKTNENYINESKRLEVNTSLLLNEQHLKTEESHVTEIPNKGISNSNDDLRFLPPSTSGIGVLFRKSSSTRLSAEFSNTLFSYENDNHFSNSFTIANDVTVTSNTNISETASRLQDTEPGLTSTTNVSESCSNASSHFSSICSHDTDGITSRHELPNFIYQNMSTSPFSGEDTIDGGIIFDSSQSKGVSNSPVVYFKNQTQDSSISSQPLKSTSNIANRITPTILHESSLQSPPSGLLRFHDKIYFLAKEEGCNLGREEHSPTVKEHGLLSRSKTAFLPLGGHSAELVDDEKLLKLKRCSPTLVDTDCIHRSKSPKMDTVPSNNNFVRNIHSPSSELTHSRSPANVCIENSPKLEHDESHHRFRSIIRSPVGSGGHARRSTWNDSSTFPRQTYNKGIANYSNVSTSTEDIFSTATNSPWASNDDISQYKTPYGKDIFSLAHHSPWKSHGDMSSRSRRFKRTNVDDVFSQARNSPWVSKSNKLFQANRSPQRRLASKHPVEWQREEFVISTPRSRHYSSPSGNVEARKRHSQRLPSSLTSIDRSESASILSRDTKAQEIQSQGISNSLTSLDRSVSASSLVSNTKPKKIQSQRIANRWTSINRSSSVKKAKKVQTQVLTSSLTSLDRSVNDSFDDHLEVSSLSEEKDSMVEEFLST